MKTKRLLDCTLRDGGYIQDWRFGRAHSEGIFDGLAGAGVEFIETGFLDARVAFEEGRSIVPDMESLNRLYAGRDKNGAKALVMIDYGTCGIENLRPRAESFPDGIRVMFRKQERKEALDFCAALKARGYMVFAQPVSVTGYNDEELGELIELTNEVAPYAVFVVDTYGLLHTDDVQAYIDRLDKELLPEIALGYHGHNNFQMAYANGVSVLARETERDLIVDGSLYGMGKNAGNAPTELLAMYMQNAEKKRYDVIGLLETIEEHILPFYTTPTWGYRLPYFLAAYRGCHPRYVLYYREKKGLSLRRTSDLLAAFREEKKLLYDEEYAASMLP